MVQLSLGCLLSQDCWDKAGQRFTRKMAAGYRVLEPPTVRSPGVAIIACAVQAWEAAEVPQALLPRGPHRATGPGPCPGTSTPVVRGGAWWRRRAQAGAGAGGGGVCLQLRAPGAARPPAVLCNRLADPNSLIGRTITFDGRSQSPKVVRELVPIAGTAWAFLSVSSLLACGWQSLNHDSRFLSNFLPQPRPTSLTTFHISSRA